MQLPEAPQDAPMLVGFSGGLDSTVLLHLLRQQHDDLRAIHIHHGLHADADGWAAHCERECAALGVPLRVVRVTVDRASGLGPEGAARAARHTAFAAALGAGELLALAHHQDDQAETFLLRALRGSGTDGLAAMRPWRAYARGWLWRPLLGLTRAELARYAHAHGLRWVEDPSNASADADRNFLRGQVLPLLRERWPSAPATLARSAMLCAQAGDLLGHEDADCLTHCQAAVAAAIAHPALLSVATLRTLPDARRARVLRHWIATLGLPPLPARLVARIEAELLSARADARPRCEWSGARIERWRDLLHAGRIRPPLPSEWAQTWAGQSPLALPDGDQLALTGADRFDAPMQVRARRGGERITLPGRRHSHALKHLLQDAAMPPWQRAQLPLLFDADGELLAAGDRIISARLQAWLEQHQAALVWSCLA